MNKIIKTLLILLIPGGMLFGQQSATSTPNENVAGAAQTETVQLCNELALSAGQYTKVMQINISYQNELAAFHSDSKNYSDAEILSKLKDIRSNHVKSLLNEFTPGQIEQYKQLHQGN